MPATALAGKTVIDTCNYGPERDGNIPELDSTSLTSSELLLRYLPDAELVKAFNNIFFKHLLSLARPAGWSGAASMGFSSAGTTKLVARLQEKGMIDRVRDPEDGRAFQVALTDAGQAALRAGLKAHIPRLDTAVATRLTTAQRRQLQDLLSRIDPGETTATPRPDTQ